MRGAPQVEFSATMRKIRARTSLLTPCVLLLAWLLRPTSNTNETQPDASSPRFSE